MARGKHRVLHKPVSSRLLRNNATTQVCIQAKAGQLFKTRVPRGACRAA
jgi:hypothetical protein